MGKYSVLFIEAPQAAAAMQALLDWGQLGFTVLGSTNNAQEADRIIDEAQPDVVLTEIALPRIDGLALIQRAKSRSPHTKFVIVTDFTAIDYAKAAMRLEVSAYLVKPVGVTELTHTFGQLKKKLDQARAASQNLATLKQYYQSSLPVMQANFYAALINGQLDEPTMKQLLSDYQIPFTGPFFACLVLHTSSTQRPAAVEPMLLRTHVMQQADYFFSALWQVAVFSYLGNTVMVAQLPDEAAAAKLTDDADRFCQVVKQNLEAVVTIGISPAVTSLLALPTAYKDARTAVSYRSLYGASRVINLQEVEPTEPAAFTPLNDGGVSNLLKAIHVGPTAAIEAAVDAYLKQLSQSAPTMAQHTVVVAELIGALYRFAVNNDLSVPGLTDHLKELYQRLPELAPDSLRHWLMSVGPSLNEQLKRARKNTSTALIQNAKEYVRVHYGDESLSLNDVCQALGVSNSYFSTLFKRACGESFITYLTNYRLARAARLLMETTEKSQVIGHLCGYADPNYFSSIFKKHFGASPTQYRNGLVASGS